MRLLVNIAREIEIPIVTANNLGVWKISKGKDKTALLINFQSKDDGGLITITTGGAKGSEILDLVEKISVNIFNVFANDYKLI